MKRVLHVIGAMDRGGAESLIMNLYRVIDRSVLQFDFLVHTERQCDYDEEIAALGGRILRLERFNGNNFFRYKSACRSLFSKYGKRYTAVHVHIGSCAPIILIEARRQGLYTIVHSHNTKSNLSFSEIAFRLASFPSRFLADAYLACSLQAGIDRFGKRVVRGGSFSVLKNGIPTSRFAYNEKDRKEKRIELGISENTAVFGHVGRFSEQKNHRFLLDVFQQIQSRMQDSILLLIGRGELEDEVKARVHSIGLDENVIFLGVREDIPALMASMDCFIFPSVWEGFGMVAIEAQASGLPCLLSSALPEEVTVLDSSKSLSLGDGIGKWADAAINSCRSFSGDRTEGAAMVRKAGFDIEAISKWLIGLYKEHKLAKANSQLGQL